MLANINPGDYFRSLNRYPMKLNLTVDGRVLSSITVDDTKLENEYYLKAFRRLLTIRNHQTLANLKKEPHFSIEYPFKDKQAQMPS